MAIIPVRGGSVGIPRKNARLLSGKPLLRYVLEAALGARCVDAVYVSTEDAELAEVARRAGVAVIERSVALADGTTTLDAVVVDAVAQLAAQGVEPEVVVTLQATCPLLSSATVDRAIELLRADDFDTVLSVVDDRHLTWTRDDAGRMVPEYSARKNRQLLPARFRETGGVVACKRSVLKGGGRFGERVGTVEVGKAEALDIDDAFDWWLAERFLQRRHILFRVVGDRATGLGHVSRALTLADRLIHHQVSFAVEPEHRLAREMIEARFYPLVELSSGRQAEQIRALAPALLVSDVLDTEQSEMEQFRAAGIRTVNFEDLGTGSQIADYVINEMYDRHTRQDGRVFSGPQYCVLRDEFYTASPSVPSTTGPLRALLLFGGTDPNDLTRRCLTWLGHTELPLSLTVVVGLGYPYVDEVRRLAEALPYEVDVVVHTSVLSRYMAESDFAITSAGRTVFELASLQVPMIVIAQNERECHHSFAMNAPGVLNLGRASTLGEEEFRSAVTQLATSDWLRRSLRRALASANLRDGVKTVLSIFEAALSGESERNC